MSTGFHTSVQNYKVRSWIPVRFSAGHNATSVFNSPFIIGYYMASSPKEAFEMAKKAGNDVYEVVAKNEEVIYPPSRVKVIKEEKENAEYCPF